MGWNAGLLLSAALVALGGCGGGGGREATTPDVAADRQVLVRADEKLSTAVQSRLVSVSGSQSEGRLIASQPLSLSLSAIKPSFLFGADSSGVVMLATTAFADGPVLMSIEATALAMAQTVLTTEVPADSIRALTRFAPLVAALGDALAAGQDIASAATVEQAFVALVTEAGDKSLRAAAVRPRLARPLAITNERVSVDDAASADGFVAISGLFGGYFSGVTVEDDPSGRLRVKNSMLIDWAVNTENQAGQASAVLQVFGAPALIDDGRRAVLPAGSGARKVLNPVPGVTGGLEDESVLIAYAPKTPSTGANLIIEQTPQLAAENLANLLLSQLSVVVPLPDSCVLELIKTVLKRREFVSLVSRGEPVLVLKEFQALNASAWLDVLGTLNGTSTACLAKFDRGILAAYLKKAAGWQVMLAEWLLKAGKVFDAAVDLAALQQLQQHWSTKRPLGICVAESPRRLINCVGRLELLPYEVPDEGSQTLPTLVPGAALPIRLRALDVAGRDTPFPESLAFLIDGKAASELSGSEGFVLCQPAVSGEFCRVSADGSVGLTGRAIKAASLLAGTSATIKLTVRDAAVDREASLFVRTQDFGTLDADAATLVLGQRVLLRLLDSSGYTMFGPTTWEPDVPGLVEITPVAAAFDPVQARVVVKPGTSFIGPVRISVRAANGSLMGSRVIEVVRDNNIRPAWQLMALPYRLEGLDSTGCRVTERVDADGIAAFGITPLPEGLAPGCGVYREVVTNNIKIENYVLHMSPTKSYFNLQPTLVRAGEWNPGLKSNVKQVLSVTGSLTIDYRARRAEVLDRFLRRDVFCTGFDSTQALRGTLLVKGEELWLSQSTGELRLGPLPSSSESATLMETYRDGFVTLQDLQPGGARLTYFMPNDTGNVSWSNLNTSQTCAWFP